MSTTRAVWIFLLVLTALRLALVGATQLSPDEVTQIAAHAEAAHPGIVDQVGRFYAQHSGLKLDYFDQELQLKLKEQGASPDEIKQKSRYVPNVIEPASGLTRAVLVILCEAYRHEKGPDDHTVPPVVEKLKKLAKERGLWNLFLPSESGLTNLEYAPLAELTGWSMEIAPEVTNCAAPDTGNMETLHLFATEEQSKQWLEPLLDGQIRSAFAMTEPAVASSDARNIETTMLRDGDDYVINGRKWWISGAADPRCKILIVMGRTNPDAASHQQQSMILVPIDTPGVSVERSLPVFGWQDQHGHCEISFDNVRVPVGNLLDEEGSGFAIAQARLGPGRIHHCMRAIGVAERAMALMVDRVTKRGGKIAHLDLTIVCEEPRIGPHRDAIRKRIAEIAEMSIDRVAVKATTSEQLGFTGRREGIVAMATATVRLPWSW